MTSEYCQRFGRFVKEDVEEMTRAFRVFKRSQICNSHETDHRAYLVASAADVAGGVSEAKGTAETCSNARKWADGRLVCGMA